MLVSACSTTQSAKGPVVKPKSFVTPWEYYQSTRAAVATPQDDPSVKSVAQVHSTGDDTPEEKSHIMIIGIAVGLVVVGGAVAGILLTR